MADQRKLRILVIDDEVTQRMLVKEYLEDAGHVVRQADDGRRGLKMATTTAPDVILLDVMLPSIDGFDLCRSLKQHPNTAHTPVILITASREGDVIARGLEAGADDFITKPVDWNFLADRVAHVTRKALERSQLLQLVEARPDGLDTAVVRADGVSDLPGIDELMRSAELQAEHSAHNLASEIDRLKVEHEAELARFRVENERLAGVAKTALQQAHVAVQQTHAAEIEELKAEIMAAHSDAAEREQVYSAALELRNSELRSLREAFDAKRLQDDAEIEALNAKVIELGEALAAQPVIASSDAAWSLALRSLNWQSGLAAALTARTQAAVASPGRLDASRLLDLDRTAQALATAIANFKRFAHTMASSGECQQAPVNVAALVSQIAAQAKGIAENARVRLQTQYNGSGDVIIADEARLRYAWICLIVNAVRFTPPGGLVALEISTDDDGGIRLQVRDTGVGIAPSKMEELNRVLDAVSVVPAKSGEAAGLGVAMATALARQMGGKLEISSLPNRGTTAALVFPRSKRVEQTSPVALAS